MILSWNDENPTVDISDDIFLLTTPRLDFSYKDGTWDQRSAFPCSFFPNIDVTLIANWDNMAMYNPAWLREVNGIGLRRHSVIQMRLRYNFGHTLYVILNLLFILSNINTSTGERSSQDEPEKLNCAGKCLESFSIHISFFNPWDNITFTHDKIWFYS